MDKVPDGYLVTGDALCSFNPIYGQGMSVAALEAETLEECLAEGIEGLPSRFYRSVSKVVDAPWKIAAGGDLAHPGVTGKRTLMTALTNWYVGHVQRAATRDEEVCRALVFVTGLLAPPESLFRPASRTGYSSRRSPATANPPRSPRPKLRRPRRRDGTHERRKRHVSVRNG